MATYKYSAVTSDGKKKTGVIEASSKQVVLDRLKKLEMSPLSVSLSTPKGAGLKLLTKKKVTSRDLVIFTRQLSTMVSAGVPLTGALATLEDQSENKYFKKVINSVQHDVEGGQSIGESLEKFPNVFNDVFVNMVKAGEEGGILDEILKRLATQMEKNETIRKKIKSASTYPKVVGGITLIAFFGVMNVIVPKIGAILLDLGGPDAKLPPLTQAMLIISAFSKKYAIPIIILTAIIIYVLNRYVKTPKGKYQLHSLLLRIPVLKEVISKIAIARFARTFSSLLAAGVTILDSLQVTAGAIGNKVIEKELLEAAAEVKAGHQLSEPLSQSPHFPKIVSQMIAIGEETGEIDIILVKVADFYEEEVDATIDGLSSIIEPLMIVVLGGMVGLVAASVMGPIASLSSNIK
ncbi:MAG: type II secretion system F family protein [Candidatus Saccharimonadales bacterium]